jgi:hypothetical protein
LAPANHGALNVRSGKLKVGRISRYPKLEISAHRIFHQPNPTYKGAAKGSCEVRSASGKLDSHTARITVKEATAADAKPNPDADIGL